MNKYHEDSLRSCRNWKEEARKVSTKKRFYTLAGFLARIQMAYASMVECQILASGREREERDKEKILRTKKEEAVRNDPEMMELKQSYQDWQRGERGWPHELGYFIIDFGFCKQAVLIEEFPDQVERRTARMLRENSKGPYSLFLWFPPLWVVLLVVALESPGLIFWPVVSVSVMLVVALDWRNKRKFEKLLASDPLYSLIWERVKKTK